MWLSSRTGTCLWVPTPPLKRKIFKKKTNSRKVNTPTQKTSKKTPGSLENILMTFDLAVMIKEATEYTKH